MLGKTYCCILWKESEWLESHCGTIVLRLGQLGFQFMFGYEVHLLTLGRLPCLHLNLFTGLFCGNNLLCTHSPPNLCSFEGQWYINGTEKLLLLRVLERRWFGWKPWRAGWENKWTRKQEAPLSFYCLKFRANFRINLSSHTHRPSKWSSDPCCWNYNVPDLLSLFLLQNKPIPVFYPIMSSVCSTICIPLIVHC